MLPATSVVTAVPDAFELDVPPKVVQSTGLPDGSYLMTKHLAWKLHDAEQSPVVARLGIVY
jgi:hypothetical protein